MRGIGSNDHGAAGVRVVALSTVLRTGSTGGGRLSRPSQPVQDSRVAGAATSARSGGEPVHDKGAFSSVGLAEDRA